MDDTFQIRRLFIKNAPSMTAILEEYPKFKDFNGGLSDAEFVKLYPEVESMLGHFPSSYTSRILSYVLHKRMDIEERIGKVHDENLSSLMYLADLLPVTGLKKRKLDDDRPNFPSEALITFAGINSSFESIIQKRRCRQSYLMTTVTEEERIFFFLY